MHGDDNQVGPVGRKEFKLKSGSLFLIDFVKPKNK